MTPITNFGGNLRFTPAHLYEPSTEAEVVAILTCHAHGKIRVVGALHSWSPAVVCEDALVDLRRFDGVEIERDADGQVWAIVGGGCRIKHLLRKLHRLGAWTIPSLGLITEQTIAGAISTATHGSGMHSLSHYIAEMRVAAYDAKTGNPRIYVWRDGPPHANPLPQGTRELSAARCALGCMGIILSVRFRCVPKYEVEETIVACATLDDVLAGEADFPLQQFYLAPHLWRYFAQRRRATGGFRKRRRLSAKLYRAWWFCCIDVGLHLAIKTLNAVGPWAIRFFYRHILAKTILKNVAVIDHSERMLVMKHELFKHLEIEIFVPARFVRHAARMIRAVLEAFDGAMSMENEIAADLERIGMREELEQMRGTFTFHYPITFRRVLADRALISMTSGSEEPWYAISFITYQEPREPFYALASFLARAMMELYEARLHWGKYYPVSGTEIEHAYPGLAEFRAFCAGVDPNGAFRNEFAERVLFHQSAKAQ